MTCDAARGILAEMLRDPSEGLAMPIHDWTRVRPNRFHDFHQKWTIAICNSLNTGRLPPGYFTIVEQRAGGPEPDVVTLELTPPAGPTSGGNGRRSPSTQGAVRG